MIAAAIALSAALVAVGAAWVGRRGSEFALPARLHVDRVLARLDEMTGPGVAVAGAAGARVRVGRLNARRHPAAGRLRERKAIVAPPPARITYRVDAPAGALLVFAIGVERAQPQAPDAAGVRFRVRVGGRESFTRVLNPAASRRDRHWHEGEVDLGTDRDGTVEIELATEAAGPGPLAGTPGWSGVRLVSRAWRERLRASASQPSLLVLLVDTLRADGLGCYGAALSPSPTLDQVAAGGLVFEQAIAQSSWTLPSIATLFTGLHPATHGVGRAGGTAPATYLQPGIPTLARQAGLAGITTVGMSASVLVSKATNLRRGFETFVEFPWNPETRAAAPASRLNARFLRWLARNREFRFLAYLHYMEPHEPYVPSDAHRPARPANVREAVARGDLRDLLRAVAEGREAGLDPAEVAHLRRLYEGTIRGWDDALADLLDGLDALGVRESTVVLVTSDHGEEFQEHGGLLHGFTLYDEVLRVPLVIAGPGIPRGRVPAQAEGIDLLPTAAGLLGFAPTPGLPGRDLLAPAADTHPALSELGRALGGGRTRTLASLRTPAWKLVRDETGDRFEYYDLVRDPGERQDRFAQAPEAPARVETLRRTRAAAAVPLPAPAPDPLVEERLRALGYLQ